MSRKYKFNDPMGLYFITTATVFWLEVFTRIEYKDIIINSLKYCIKEKGLIVHAYVIMSNHIHLIISRKETGNEFSAIIRDFKKFTAMKLIKAIKENKDEGRQELFLGKMKQAGYNNRNNTNYQFWQQNNQPIELDVNWIDQKLNYIHENPVKKGWVAEGHEYLYSSARNYVGLESPLKVVSIYEGEYI